MRAYVGIDVSKGYADYCVMDQNKKQLDEGFQLDDTRKGHDCLKKILLQLVDKKQVTEILCAVESTGGFENNWYAGLIEMSKTMPVKVARLNPSGVKNNIAAGLERNVTDALSSRYIAGYMIAHPEKVVFEQQSAYYSSFRSLNKHISLLKKQSTQLINEFKMNLYSVFPEMMRYCKQGVPNWVLVVLEKYPLPSAIARLQPKQLAKIKHVTIDKATALIKKAKESVASRTDATIAFLIGSLASQIRHKQDLIAAHKKYLADNCEGKEVELLKSITGVGAYSAAAIMVEIEDIRRFSSPRHLASFFGVHPALKESGDKKSPYRMSKKGRSSMRATLYMCANVSVIHDPHMKAIYHKHRSRGKGHKQAVGIIMHKLLRVIWGILSSGKPYDAKVDKGYQEKKAVNVETVKSEEVNKKRRFQSLDKEAPISNRQNKTRKAHLESQAECIGQVRDHQNAPLAKV